MIFDTTGLRKCGEIIDNGEVQLTSYMHDSGTLILSANLIQPKGLVFFETDETYLQLFYENKINLQELFETTAQNLVTVSEDFECKLYMHKDADIVLCGGENLFSEF